LIYIILNVFFHSVYFFPIVPYYKSRYLCAVLYFILYEHEYNDDIYINFKKTETEWCSSDVLKILPMKRLILFEQWTQQLEIKI